MERSKLLIEVWEGWHVEYTPNQANVEEWEELSQGRTDYKAFNSTDGEGVQPFICGWLHVS